MARTRAETASAGARALQRRVLAADPDHGRGHQAPGQEGPPGRRPHPGPAQHHHPSHRGTPLGFPGPLRRGPPTPGPPARSRRGSRRPGTRGWGGWAGSRGSGPGCRGGRRRRPRWTTAPPWPPRWQPPASAWSRRAPGPGGPPRCGRRRRSAGTGPGCRPRPGPRRRPGRPARPGRTRTWAQAAAARAWTAPAPARPRGRPPAPAPAPSPPGAAPRPTQLCDPMDSSPFPLSSRTPRLPAGSQVLADLALCRE